MPKVIKLYDLQNPSYLVLVSLSSTKFRYANFGIFRCFGGGAGASSLHTVSVPIVDIYGWMADEMRAPTLLFDNGFRTTIAVGWNGDCLEFEGRSYRNNVPVRVRAPYSAARQLYETLFIWMHL